MRRRPFFVRGSWHGCLFYLLRLTKWLIFFKNEYYIIIHFSITKYFYNFFNCSKFSVGWLLNENNTRNFKRVDIHFKTFIAIRYFSVNCTSGQHRITSRYLHFLIIKFNISSFLQRVTRIYWKVRTETLCCNGANSSEKS